MSAGQGLRLAPMWVLLGLIGGAALGWGLRQPAPAPQPPDLVTAYRRVAPVVVDVFIGGAERRMGSGFAVSATEVVTARHLVIGVDGPVEVVDASGREHVATLVGSDARTDLALLTVDGGLTAATLGVSTTLSVGNSVFAVGNPYGLGHSLSAGVVGGVGRRLSPDIAGPRVHFLQLSIPLNPGNSGGPIFDAEGRVVGVLTGTHTRGQGIAFAVPVEALAKGLEALRTGHHVTRAFLGVRAEDVGERVVVRSVIPSGPAEVAGVRPGDVLTAFDGALLSAAADLYARLDELAGGHRTTIRLLREGKLVVLDVALADWAQQPVAAAGMTLRPRPGSGGLVVAVRPRSRAEHAGIEVDDVIRAVDGVPVQAPADVKDAMAAGAVQVEVLRSGLSMTFRFEDVGG